MKIVRNHNRMPMSVFLLKLFRLATLGLFLGDTGEALADIRAAEVDLAYVSRLARERALHPFVSPAQTLPRFLRGDVLNREQYDQIRFRHSRALWSAEHLPFRIEFFHPGCLYEEPVRINEDTAEYTRRIRFVSTETWSYLWSPR